MIDRRQFLRTSILSVAGATVAPLSLAAPAGVVGQAVVLNNYYMLSIPIRPLPMAIFWDQYEATKPKGLNPSGVIDPRK